MENSQFNPSIAGLKRRRLSQGSYSLDAPISSSCQAKAGPKEQASSGGDDTCAWQDASRKQPAAACNPAFWSLAAAAGTEDQHHLSMSSALAGTAHAACSAAADRSNPASAMPAVSFRHRSTCTQQPSGVEAHQVQTAAVAATLDRPVQPVGKVAEPAGAAAGELFLAAVAAQPEVVSALASMVMCDTLPCARDEQGRGSFTGSLAYALTVCRRADLLHSLDATILLTVLWTVQSFLSQYNSCCLLLHQWMHFDTGLAIDDPAVRVELNQMPLAVMACQVELLEACGWRLWVDQPDLRNAACELQQAGGGLCMQRLQQAVDLRVWQAQLRLQQLEAAHQQQQHQLQAQTRELARGQLLVAEDSRQPPPPQQQQQQQQQQKRLKVAAGPSQQRQLEPADSAPARLPLADRTNTMQPAATLARPQQNISAVAGGPFISQATGLPATQGLRGAATAAVSALATRVARFCYTAGRSSSFGEQRARGEGGGEATAQQKLLQSSAAAGPPGRSSHTAKRKLLQLGWTGG